LFKRNSLLGLRASIWILISLVLIITSTQVYYIKQLRATLNVVVTPLQFIVDTPIQWFRQLSSNFVTQQQLLEENAQLRARQLLLEARLQKLLAIEQDNAQLKQLLSSSSNAIKGKVLVAQLLAVSLDPAIQQIVVDKGKDSAIYVGQPVLDAFGVMGQIVEVNPLTSYVLLITDTRSAIPVQDTRSGVRAIAAGSGDSNQLTVLNVPDTSDIAVGDVLVTSGLGGRFPYGYPVGVIRAIDKKTGDGFANVSVSPSAHVDRSRQVVLVWPENSLTINSPIAIEEARN
jgi:rod shape-determining protein MreC